MTGRASWSSNPRSSSSVVAEVVAPVMTSGGGVGYPMGVVAKLKVFVGGLAQSTSEGEMREYFSAFGSSVAEVEIKIDKLTGRSRGFGFVTILGCETNRLFNTNHKLSNKTVDVAEVTETKVVVGNLKLTTTTEQVISHFSRYGNILTCEAEYRSMTVVFESADAATNALAENSHFIDGVKVEVRKADPSPARILKRGGISGVSTSVNTPVMSGIAGHQRGYGAFGGYGEFDMTGVDTQRILARLEYGALGTPSSYGVYPVPGYDMVPGQGTTNRYHPIGI